VPSPLHSLICDFGDIRDISGADVCAIKEMNKIDEIKFHNNFNLNLAISYHISCGYRIKFQSETDVEMGRSKRRFLFFWSNENLFITVDNKGNLTITNQNGKVRVVKNGQPIALYK
jgi:hypothetical protein